MNLIQEECGVSDLLSGSENCTSNIFVISPAILNLEPDYNVQGPFMICSTSTFTSTQMFSILGATSMQRLYKDLQTLCLSLSNQNGSTVSGVGGQKNRTHFLASYMLSRFHSTSQRDVWKTRSEKYQLLVGNHAWVKQEMRFHQLGGRSTDA